MTTLYGPKEVAEQLGIKISTLRKYADLLEKASYSFHKNERGHRAYYDGDLMALRKLIELKENTNMALEMVVEAVVTWSKGTDMAINATPQTTATNEIQALHEKIDAQAETIQNQNELLKALTEKFVEMEARQARQEERASQRDANLMTAIRSLQETKQLIASATSQTRWQRFLEGVGLGRKK